MRNIAKKRHNKFDPDTKRNDGAFGFFQRASPPNNNNNKISSVSGQVPAPKIEKNREKPSKQPTKMSKVVENS